jgi:hypothetical protein
MVLLATEEMLAGTTPSSRALVFSTSGKGYPEAYMPARLYYRTTAAQSEVCKVVVLSVE